MLRVFEFTCDSVALYKEREVQEVLVQFCMVISTEYGGFFVKMSALLHPALFHNTQFSLLSFSCGS
jgi:hypothetical protein